MLSRWFAEHEAEAVKGRTKADPIATAHRVPHEAVQARRVLIARYAASCEPVQRSLGRRRNAAQRCDRVSNRAAECQMCAVVHSILADKRRAVSPAKN